MKKHMLSAWSVVALIASCPAFAVSDACDAYGDLSGSEDATSAEIDYSGSASGDYAGRSVAILDFNGDGDQDIAIGAPGADPNGAQSGAVYIFYGPLSADGEVETTTADVTIMGIRPNDFAGWDVANLGDVDGDGVDDIGIGAPRFYAVYDNVAKPYAAVVYGDAAHAGTLDLTSSADVIIEGSALGEYTGYELAGGGDINGDGFDDIAIGSPNATGASGAVFVFLGGGLSGLYETDRDENVKFEAKDVKDQLGWTLAFGDFDGDTNADLAMGAPQSNSGGLEPNAGEVYVFMGGQVLAPVENVSGADYSFYGRWGSKLGSAVASAGDQNGDGKDELLVGSPKWYQGALGRAGAVFQFNGGAYSGAYDTTGNDAFIYGQLQDSLFGNVIAAGDFDNDGTPDVLVGAERMDSNASNSGRAYVFKGPLSGTVNATNAAMHIDGMNKSDMMGMGVAVGDVNSDGYIDAIPSSYRATGHGNGTLKNRGRVAVFFGGSDLVDVTTYYNDTDLDGFGTNSDTEAACPGSQTAGYVIDGGDCNDGSNIVYPGADETACNGTDYNCDGFSNGLDNDGDSHTSCFDCDDGNNQVSPSALERCDDIDNNCDGVVDEGTAVNALPWYPDVDLDTYGDEASRIDACETPPGFVGVTLLHDGGDCNDADPAINPDAIEVCDGVDNDCANGADEATALDATVYFSDADIDGYGDPDNQISACIQPANTVTNNRDCNDSDTGTNPLIAEVCDLVDNDCSGMDYIGGAMSFEDAGLFTLWGNGADSFFGSQVALIPDWNADGFAEVAVGAPEDSQGALDGGAVYIYASTIYGGTVDFNATKADGSPYYLARIVADTARQGVGTSLAVGDLNGDGVQDLVVGAPGHNNVLGGSVGLVAAFYGPLSGDYDLSDADVTIEGIQSGENAGWSVAMMDIDNDGFDDLLYGRPEWDGPNTKQGAVSLVYGGGSLSAIETADVSWTGEAATKIYTGVDVFAAGDLNDDGFEDFGVGAPFYGSGVGRAYIFYGRAALFANGTTTDADVIYQGGNTLDSIGIGGSTAGDFNGDGNDDLVLGSGRRFAYLFFGGSLTGGDVHVVHDYKLEGSTNMAVGEIVAGGGDFNADGFDDLAIAAYDDDTNGENSGAVYIVYGAADLDAYVSGGTIDIEAGESFGRFTDPSVPAVPVISAQNDRTWEGGVVAGINAFDQTGRSVVMGDINGDGNFDLIAGAPFYDPDTLTRQNSGAVYGILGGPYGTDTDSTDAVTFYRDDDGDTFADEDISDAVNKCEMHVLWDETYTTPLEIDQISLTTDCDDDRADVYPGAFEIAGDLVDNDCDGFDSPNNLPFLTGHSFTPDPIYTTTSVTSNPLIDDLDLLGPEPTTLSAFYDWSVNTVSTGQTGATLTSGFFVKGDLVEVEVTPWDTRDTGTPITFGITVSNTAPTLGDCQVDNLTPDVTDAVNALGEGLADVDTADTPFINYQWQLQVSGSGPWLNMPGETALSFAGCQSTGLCKKGDSLRVQCTPDDGDDVGTTLSAPPVTIANAPPFVTSCVVTPGSPDTADSLVVSAAGSDPDGDPVVFQMLWYENFKVMPGPQTGTILPSALTSHNKDYYAECTPGDTFTLGTAVPSNSVSVSNTAPTQPTVSLTPASPRSEQTISVNIDVPSTDLDLDPITYNYYWFVNSSPVSNPKHPSLTASLDHSFTAFGDVVDVKVEPDDGQDQGTPGTASATVLNTPPSVDSVSLAPDPPDTTEMVTASPSGSFDYDSHTINHVYTWRVAGIVVPGETGPTLDPSYFVRGQTIDVSLTVDDGFDTGNTVTATTVTVGNYVPVVTSCVLTPPTPNTTANLSMAVVCFDADPGDTHTTPITWFDTGLENTSTTGLTMSSAETSHFDTWNGRCVCDDSIAASAPLTSNNIVVQNSTPTQPTIDVTPSSPTSSDNLAGVITVASTDLDPEDTVTYSWLWYKNSSPTGITTQVVSYTDTIRGEQWYVVGTPSDSYISGASDQSGTVTIGNSAPSFTAANIQPTSDIFTDDAFSVIEVGWFDEDSDPEGYTYQWQEQINATGPWSNLVGQTAATLASSQTVKNNAYRVAVTAHDGFVSGNTLNSSGMTVQDSPPTDPAISVSPNPAGESSTLSCDIDVASTDLDSDSVSYTWEWRNLTVPAGPFGGQTRGGPFTVGHVWECSAWASAAGLDSGTVTASTTIVDIDAPAAPTMSVPDRYLDPATVAFSGTCEAACTLDFTCAEPTGSTTSITWSETCTGGGTYSTSTSLVRGYNYNCSATCTDASLNTSGPSPVREVMSCANEDDYEAAGGLLEGAYGDTSGAAIDEWSALPDDNSVTITVDGNIPTSDVYDWYLFHSSDNLAADVAAGFDDYDFEVDMTSGSADFNFRAYLNTSGNLECSGEPDVDTYNFYFDGATWPGKACSATNVYGKDLCADFDNDYFIRVNRQTATNCNSYVLTVTNNAQGCVEGVCP